MKILDFEWAEENIEHIARHHVSPDEAEEACKQHPLIRRGPRRRYLIYGRTSAGRYLFIVSHYQGQGVVHVITARDMNWTEKRLYQEHR